MQKRIMKVPNDLNKNTELYKNINKQLGNLAQTYNNIAASIVAGMRERFSEYVQDIQKTFHEKINTELIRKVFLILSEANYAISENTRNVTKLLGEKGWYISLDMPLSSLVKIVSENSESDKDDLDEIMSEYFREHSQSIIDNIALNFPNRGKVIRSAFKAHNNGDYDLSIPVFLAQADGICYEIIGIQLYGRKKGKPKTEKYVEKLSADTFMTALLEPFRTPLPISASKCDRNEINDYLNRHAVLHGEYSDYGIEINSLKSMSLLNYIAQVLLKAKEKQKNVA